MKKNPCQNESLEVCKAFSSNVAQKNTKLTSEEGLFVFVVETTEEQRKDIFVAKIKLYPPQLQEKIGWKGNQSKHDKMTSDQLQQLVEIYVDWGTLEESSFPSY